MEKEGGSKYTNNSYIQQSGTYNCISWKAERIYTVMALNKSVIEEIHINIVSRTNHKYIPMLKGSDYQYSPTPTPRNIWALTTFSKRLYYKTSQTNQCIYVNDSSRLLNTICKYQHI